MRWDLIILVALLIGIAIAGNQVFDNFMSIRALNEDRGSQSGHYISDMPENSYSNLSSEVAQFYPSMRFPEKTISYSIEDACDENKVDRIENTIEILEDSTVLNFNQVSKNGDIEYFCSEEAPEPTKKNYYVAGEGGPTEIVNNSVFSVILQARVSLFRDETCEETKVALHETLHALGFDHNSNRQSIMYPTTSCRQQLDEAIINRINELYSIPSLPDLKIKSVDASKEGRYVVISISISNVGLKESKASKLTIEADGDEVKVLDINETEIGTTKYIKITNLAVPRDASELEFEIEQVSGEEIDYSNNQAKVDLAE